MIDQLSQATDKNAWRQAAPRLGSVRWSALLSWRVLLWLISFIPGVIYLVVGGFPSTQDIQKTMTSTTGTAIVVAGLIAGMITVIIQLPGLMRVLHQLPSPAWHETRLRPWGRLLMSATSLLISVGFLVRLLIGSSVTAPIIRNYHALDALSSGGQSRPNSPNKLNGNTQANKVAEELGYKNAEDLKEAFVGAKGRHFDMFIDTKTREVWLGTKGQSEWVPTGLFWK
jgi:hypothetical protein